MAFNVKNLRKNSKLTQAELAEEAESSLKLINDIEREKVWPRDDTLLKIANALKVTSTELLLDPDLTKPTNEQVLEIVKEALEQSLK